MRFSALLVKLSLGIAFLVLCNSALFAQDAELVRHFDYDAKAPLEMKVLGTEKRGEATVYDITYASPKAWCGAGVSRCADQREGLVCGRPLGPLVLDKLRNAQSQTVSR